MERQQMLPPHRRRLPLRFRKPGTARDTAAHDPHLQDPAGSSSPQLPNHLRARKAGERGFGQRRGWEDRQEPEEISHPVQTCFPVAPSQPETPARAPPPRRSHIPSSSSPPHQCRRTDTGGFAPMQGKAFQPSSPPPSSLVQESALNPSKLRKDSRLHQESWRSQLRKVKGSISKAMSHPR